MYNEVMQFEVPQFIEIEDKIFGPLTWRQFLYLAGGIGMGAALFMTDIPYIPTVFEILFGIAFAGLAGALAFYPINGRPFSYFIEAVYNYFLSSRLYLWRKQQDFIYKHKFTPDTKTQPFLHQNPIPGEGNKKDIASLARRLELEALKKDEV